MLCAALTPLTPIQMHCFHSLPAIMEGGPLSRVARTLAGIAGHARLMSADVSTAESVPSNMPLWKARRFADLQARPRKPLPPLYTPGAPRIKYKSAFKRCGALAQSPSADATAAISCTPLPCRASSVMAEVNKESWARMQLKMAAFRPPLPDFNPGDAVEIQVRVV